MSTLNYLTAVSRRHVSLIIKAVILDPWPSTLAVSIQFPGQKKKKTSTRLDILLYDDFVLLLFFLIRRWSLNSYFPRNACCSACGVVIAHLAVHVKRRGLHPQHSPGGRWLGCTYQPPADNGRSKQTTHEAACRGPLFVYWPTQTTLRQVRQHGAAGDRTHGCLLSAWHLSVWEGHTFTFFKKKCVDVCLWEGQHVLVSVFTDEASAGEEKLSGGREAGEGVGEGGIGEREWPKRTWDNLYLSDVTLFALPLLSEASSLVFCQQLVIYSLYTRLYLYSPLSRYPPSPPSHLPLLVASAMTQWGNVIIAALSS